MRVNTSNNYSLKKITLHGSTRIYNLQKLGLYKN